MTRVLWLVIAAIWAFAGVTNLIAHRSGWFDQLLIAWMALLLWAAEKKIADLQRQRDNGWRQSIADVWRMR